jgi:hypothetical protein
VSADPGKRPTAWGALVLAHAFIAWSAASGRLRLEDVAWLYWYGGFFLAASCAWRMHRSLVVARNEAGIVLGIFAFPQILFAVLLQRHGYALAWSLDAAIALPWILANYALDLRRHLAFDELQSPSSLHFLGLWFARCAPFALMFGLPAAFPERILHGSPATLLAFVCGVAAIDILLHLIGPAFGRQLTVWQRKRYAKSSKNYLKWYRPPER